jgi:hypothetical protein
MSVTADQLVAKYVELRDRCTAAKKKYEAEIAPWKDGMEKLEGHLQQMLDATGANSMNTDHGTIFRTYKESATVADWDAFMAYIQNNDEWGLLERRVSKTYVKELMDEQRDGSYRNPPPPGVNFVRLAAVQVRRKS